MPPIQSRKVEQLRRHLLDREAYATVLAAILMDAYGTEALSWAAQTMQMEVQEDFGVTLPGPNLDKWMAVVAILTTDVFFQDLRKFIDLCNVLCDDAFDPRVFNPADAAEMAWAITEALLLNPPEEDAPFCDDICWYIGYQLAEEGLTTPPDVLRIALQDTPVSDPQTEFADDPLMYKSFFENQQGKVQQINTSVRENLQRMIQQLEQLPLTTGDASGLTEQLQKGWSK